MTDKLSYLHQWTQVDILHIKRCYMRLQLFTLRP